MDVGVHRYIRAGREESDVLWIVREEEDELETEIECQVSIFCVSNGVAIREADRRSWDVSQVY